jgi:hypothetical protein
VSEGALDVGVAPVEAAEDEAEALLAVGGGFGFLDGAGGGHWLDCAIEGGGVFLFVAAGTSCTLYLRPEGESKWL